MTGSDPPVEVLGETNPVVVAGRALSWTPLVAGPMDVSAAAQVVLQQQHKECPHSRDEEEDTGYNER